MKNVAQACGQRHNPLKYQVYYLGLCRHSSERWWWGKMPHVTLYSLYVLHQNIMDEWIIMSCQTHQSLYIKKKKNKETSSLQDLFSTKLEVKIHSGKNLHFICFCSQWLKRLQFGFGKGRQVMNLYPVRMKCRNGTNIKCTWKMFYSSKITSQKSLNANLLYLVK